MAWPVAASGERSALTPWRPRLRQHCQVLAETHGRKQSSLSQLRKHSELHFRDSWYLPCPLTPSLQDPGSTLACAGVRSDVSFKNKPSSALKRS